MSDPSRMHRICERHDGVFLDDEGHAVGRRHELLCSRRHAAVVDERLRKWIDKTEDFRTAGVVRVRLKKRARVDIRSIANDLDRKSVV